MNTLSLIRQKYPMMSPVEKRIADCILKEPEAAVHATIVYIAANAGVSQGSVINFASSLGYSGFSQLKIHLAQSLKEFCSQDALLEEDTPKQVMRKLMDRAAGSFASTFEALGGEIEQAVQWITQADKIILVGYANSHFVASDLAFRLMRLGLPAQAHCDPLVAGVACMQMTKKSVLLAVSHFGRTRELLACVRTAKEQGAHVIGLTSNSYSPLARESDLTLMAVSVEAENYQEAVTARLTQLLLGDCLVQCVANQIGTEAEVNLDKMVEIYEQNRETMSCEIE